MENTTTITVNGKPLQIRKNLTVSQLLQTLKLREDLPVAVEVNRAIIPKTRHGEHMIQAGDTIEIVTFAGGG